MTFNAPESLCVYNYNHTAVLFDLYMQPIYLLDRSINDNLCKSLSYNFKNYTNCAYQIDEKFPFKIVDHRRVRYMTFIEESEQDANITKARAEEGDYREVYIADTGNHCIRKLTVIQANVETVAGVCGVPGFVDGYYQTNLLDSPEIVGIDAQGYLFIYDAGNKCIRMMEPNGFLHTLIDGACREDLN